MKIGVIMYGGIGDHLLSNRFVPAILDYHQCNKVDIIRPYLNNIDEHSGKNHAKFIQDSFPNFYADLKFVQKKESKHKDIWIDMQMTVDDFHGSNEYDFIYNLVPDALYWTTYEHLPIKKHFEYFPYPHIQVPKINLEDYVFFHPIARENQHPMHRFSEEYAKKFVSFSERNGIKLICPISKNDFFLKNYCDNISLEYYICDLTEMWSFAKQAKAAICCDSSPKYFAMTYGKPTAIVTNIINQDFMIRWLLNPNNVFSMNTEPETIFQKL